MRETVSGRGADAVRPAGAPPAPPPLAVAAALALWGWQADCLPWALAMGTLIEVARFSSLRLDPGQDDFNRLWNLTTLLFLGVGLYLFLAREGLGSVGSLVNTGSSSTRLEGLRQLSQTALAFLRAIPFVLFLFVLAHAWSRTGPLPWTTFSLLLRARAARERMAFTLPAPALSSPPARGLRLTADAPNERTSTLWSEPRVHPGFPYLALVLFAAGASATRSPLFLPLCAAVVSWALWPWRNPRFRAPTWAGLLLLVLGVTFAGQQGLLALRAAWQGLESRLAEGSGEGRFDQQRNITALGSVGRIKQSSRTVLRVYTASDRAPGLLREAAFNRFRGNTWTVALRDFQPVVPELDSLLWPLSPARHRGESMQIATYSVNGEAPLSLPADALAVRNLTAQVLETNVFGAARCQFALPLVTYAVEHGPGGGFDGAPCVDDTDLDHLPWQDQAVIRAVADELGLPSLPPNAAVESLTRYFAAAFRYSLWQRTGARPDHTGILERFLRETRAGHCEYFATATVLLLRAAGIPTRYAVGYSVSQRRGEAWIARSRDAHAWCRAYLDGRWLDVDTTPATWHAEEQNAARWWEALSDRLSDAWYRFSQWRQQAGHGRLYLFAASMVVLAWLAWRQLRGSRWRRARRDRSTAMPHRPPPGLDSEFYGLAHALETTHGPRVPHETWPAWTRRVGLLASPEASRFQEALHLHYRLRFDPEGLPPAERERLRQLAALTPGSAPPPPAAGGRA